MKLTTKQLDTVRQLIMDEINLIQDYIDDGTYDHDPKEKKDMKAKVKELHKIFTATEEK